MELEKILFISLLLGLWKANRKNKMEKDKFLKVIYVCKDIEGRLYVFEHLKNCPVYYDDEKGILVGEYVLERVGTLKKEIKYTHTVEH